jgi:ubiquinone/menaquinone biosynthesis C-methylase UbiE
MSLTELELARREEFERQYRDGQRPAVQAVERTICGCDYGGTSWATRAEADQIIGALDLGPGVSLLEVGAGSGWPALYLAERASCNVTLTDLPPGALRIALGRASRDGISGACHACAADAANLPFRDGYFDAINHSDVLCCLVQKREVLAECRRVIRPGGRMAFSVIYIAPSLSPMDHAAAIATAPAFAESDKSYPTMISETGWSIRQRHDLTSEFMANCRKKVSAEESLRAELEPLTSAASFDARHARYRRRIGVLERRHIRRELFVVDPVN